MRKIICNLAMSLDGFIADDSGGYGWIKGDGSNACDTALKYDFSRFLSEIDTVVMGRRCFDQGMHRDFKDKKVYVASKTKRADEANVFFQTISAALSLRSSKGRKAYLPVRRGRNARQLLREDIIDEYIIGIIPVILGKGRPLFLHGTPQIALRLHDYFFEDGIAILRYTKKRKSNHRKKAVPVKSTAFPFAVIWFYKEESA